MLHYSWTSYSVQHRRRFTNAGSNDNDMKIMNNLYNHSALVLPHQPYVLLSGEFHETTHHAYLGNSLELWGLVKVMEEAKFIHFPD